MAVDLLGYPFTDSGNAERLAALHRDRIRYCVPQKSWLVWDGRRWERDATRAVMQLAKQTIRRFHKQAFTIEDEMQRTAAFKWAIRSESASALLNMVQLAQAEPPLPVVPAELDRDPWVLNTLNGTVDLRTGTLRKHDRADLITKLCPVAYNPAAEHETWNRFLDDATKGDADLQGFLQRAAGYSLLGTTPEEVFFLVHGGEATGKSTFLSALRSTLGDYGATTDFEGTFVTKRGDAGIRNDLARLAGARLVVSVEVDEGKRLAQGLVKQLTGGDAVTARFLHAEFFEFVPQFALWLAANHAPKVSARDGALWRRVLRVPFVNTVPPERRDPQVKAKLTDPTVTGAAILRWAVDGCVAYQAHGLGIPPAVSQSTKSYRRENDLLADFIAAACVLDLKNPNCWTTSKVLWSTYTDWVKETSAKRPHPLSNNEFTEHLKEHGCEAKKQNHVRGWLGIRLRDETDDEQEDTEDTRTEDAPPAEAPPGEPTRGHPGHPGTALPGFSLSDVSWEKTGNCRPQPSRPSPPSPPPVESSCKRQVPHPGDSEAEPTCSVCGLPAAAYSVDEAWCIAHWGERVRDT